MAERTFSNVRAVKTRLGRNRLLISAGLGRKIVELETEQAFFSQGDPADPVFYLQKGRKSHCCFARRRGSNPGLVAYWPDRSQNA